MTVTKQTILVVDDEPAVRRLLRRCFESESYNVLEAENRQQTMIAFSESTVDLITLDVNLNGDDGLSIAREIRSVSPVPIIMVSGKGDLIDTVIGLEMGADDYISKPFQIREVLARVKSALRRGQLNQQLETRNIEHEKRSGGKHYAFAGCILNPQTRDLRSSDGSICELTTAEFDLLEVLVQNSQQAMTRDRIMDKIKGNDWSPCDRSIDNQIARVRKKLTSIGVKRAIKTIRGLGYQFTIDVEVNKTKP